MTYWDTRVALAIGCVVALAITAIYMTWRERR